MAQKIHPYGFRLGITKDWKSRWTTDKKGFGKLVVEDKVIRDFLDKKLGNAGLESVEIERSHNEVSLIIRVSKPGLVIGRGGSGVEELQKEIKKLTNAKVKLTVEEVKNAEANARLVADYISRQLKRRMSYRRVCMAATTSAMDKGAKGVKIKISGLLSGGNSIARSDVFSRGPVPRQTLRADIDYAQVTCHLIYGTIGIKVWIYNGEVEA
ncbi:30S ribosomal protein S3 [Candidatus Nomurabacteria bacterium]|uniref:Small ribosomal subunit protein uS3 n=1 Tax=candidate division WWE3 bacterium TaxID=2053526 RepID=A0A955E0U1_UNCKA|nr:30S ribosomal protein S3 [candidate division WWE3 bacterium]MCB9823778.1 30S ribosomal protein S3 [Candidatus Nomurabacteria bacterium]MCB9826816.1 30S ribosomal protein S3 [Candidatus Nomurabacteria bacterium]MCB9827573.1 30S ribosomal protein S3 [Candidatus Nomurabacteria bacterium]HXK52932.1 30S ribosomal protein S3 [bacterium]